MPSADFVAALVGGAVLEPVPDPTADTVPLPPPEALIPKIPEQRRVEHRDLTHRDDDGDEVIDDRPPAALRILTWILLTVTAVHIVLLVVDVLVLRREDAVLRQYAIEEDYLQAPGTQAVFALVDRVGSAVGVALWVTLLMFAVWFGIVGRVAEKLGRDRRIVLRHWTYIGWRLALIPLVVYLFADAARDENRPSERFAFVEDALAVNHTAIMFTSLRIVMLALLAGFVVVVWRRLSPPPRDDALPF